MADPGPSQSGAEPGSKAGAPSSAQSAAPSGAQSAAQSAAQSGTQPGAQSNSQAAPQPGAQSGSGPAAKLDDMPQISDETKARNKPSGTHYVEPSPLGIEPVEQTGVDKATNPQRSSERPAQTAEVPLGTGTHAEPPGGGGRESRGKQ